ncbi:hypothetical protein NUW54_g7218 [Trametes sanguinea]|uniref:Uncharacterized protein n=1 Tax=Trametes sanguinea TaxID=158606 RepID=A0ACC1PML7_9APHY|nr:hypothetical protein NUW54_g7218 [Trametes sanguinea]
MASNDRVRVRGVEIHRPIIYGNTAVVLTQKEREAAAHPGPHPPLDGHGAQRRASLVDSKSEGGEKQAILRRGAHAP